MGAINTLLPFISGIVSFVFAFLVLRRYLVRKGTHLLIWGIGLVLDQGDFDMLNVLPQPAGRQNHLSQSG